jgi:hypothetical protein
LRRLLRQRLASDGCGIGGISCLQSADFGLDRLDDLLPPDLKFRRDDTWRKARERERH